MPSSDSPPPAVLATFAMANDAARPFERGLVNRHWLVENGDRRLVIRRYNPARSAAAIAWEQALVRRASERGWPAAVPIAAADGRHTVEHDGHCWAAAPLLAGEPRLAGGAGAYHIQGRLLARLHRDLSGFAVEGQRPGAGKTWELDAWLAPTGAEPFNALLAAFAEENRDLASAIRRYRYRNLRELSRLHYPDLPDLPVHGDFQRDNLLWEGGQLTGLLDFDFARRDALVTDVATLLVPFEPLEGRLARSLLEGYESERPLSDAEWDLLPALARASLLWWVALQLAGWQTGTNPGATAAIARTVTQRLPALDAAEPHFGALRPAAAGR